MHLNTPRKKYQQLKQNSYCVQLSFLPAQNHQRHPASSSVLPGIVSLSCLTETPHNSTKNTPCPLLELGTTLPNMKIHIRMVLGAPPPFPALVALFLPPPAPSFPSPAGGSRFPPAAAPGAAPEQTSGAPELRQVHCQWMT